MTAAASGATDEQLLAAWVDGDEASFTQLVERYERRVYAICYRYFGNHADAEDAAQDTFVAVARRASTFTHGSRLSTWLYRVAINACNDAARKRARRPRGVTDEVDAAAGGAEDGRLVATETRAVVQAALLRLDDLSRTLVLLIGVEGLSYEEASEVTDLPVGTIKSRVHRARARLAELLTEGQ